MLTLAQAALRLGVSPSTLRGQIGKGKLRGRLIGKTWTVTGREIERYRLVSLGRVGRTPNKPPAITDMETSRRLMREYD